MKAVIIALVGCVAAVALFATITDASATQFFQVNDWQTEQQFMRFVAEYGRLYKTRDEYQMRLANFQRNLVEVEELNSANDGVEYGITEFADYTEAEFNQLLGLLPVADDENEVYGDFSTDANAIDWVAKGKVAPVKNQGACGSCWAFSAIGAIEAAHAIKTNSNGVQEWSEQQLVDCSGSFGNHGCSGGWMHYAFKYNQKNDEYAENAYPYHAKNESCKAAQHASDKLHIKTISYSMISSSESQHKGALARGPVSVAVDASKWSSYRGGVFSNCATRLNHGVLLTGFGTDKATGQEFWTIKNSWGNRWGEQGFMRLKMGNTCGIMMKSSQPVTE